MLMLHYSPLSGYLTDYLNHWIGPPMALDTLFDTPMTVWHTAV